MSQVLSADRSSVEGEAPPVGGAHGRLEASVYRFRDFQVSVSSRALLRDGCAVDLGSRAFDLLVALLRARGTVVSKRQIMQEVWPSTIVDESNLRFQMACLRRALGPERDLIKTIQGRGYLFVDEAVAVPGGDAAAPAVARDADTPSPVAAGPATIAVVEDDDNTREALDGLLRSSGYRVEAYPTSQDFMASGRTRLAECLVLDVWMPGRNGLDFQSDLKAAGVEVPIVFISGHADIHMSVRAMKAGAVEFLTKPVRHQDLLGAVSSAVRARREQV